MRILFLCLGNICRSPAAEGVVRRLAQEAGLALDLDSAGTGDWHAGEPPYGPMQAAVFTEAFLLGQEPIGARKRTQDPTVVRCHARLLALP